MAKKPSMRCQKIKIAKIEIKNHLQVTFSKPRSRLYKKAHELNTFCGVELAIIVFFPAGKVFSFGHPNVDYVVDKFIAQRRNSQPQSSALHIAEAHCRNAISVQELNLRLTQILIELEAEMKRGEAFDLMRKASQNHYWWESPVNEFGLHELEQQRDSTENMKNDVVANHANKVMVEVNNHHSSFFALNYGTVPGLNDEYGYENKPIGVTMASVNPNISNFGYDNRGFQSLYDNGGFRSLYGNRGFEAYSI